MYANFNVFARRECCLLRDNKSRSSHRSVLSRQIANLALLRFRGVAGSRIGDAVWIEMRSRRGTVTRRRERRVVDMIHCCQISKSASAHASAPDSTWKPHLSSNCE
jgi:hypothetical protein